MADWQPYSPANNNAQTQPKLVATFPCETIISCYFKNGHIEYKGFNLNSDDLKEISYYIETWPAEFFQPTENFRNTALIDDVKLKTGKTIKLSTMEFYTL